MAKNLFNSIKVQRLNTNVFDLTHDVKLSGNMADLIPIMVSECVPGDKWRIGCESLIRFSPLVSPVMHRLDVTMHYFFVPTRLVFEDQRNWEKFITNDPTAPAFPYIEYDSATAAGNPLSGYMGINGNLEGIPAIEERINPIPFAMYQMIYNEYYRDQNLAPEVPYKLIPGNNTIATGGAPGLAELLRIRKRCWEHDYFTAALPFAQAGEPVDIPLGDVVLKDNWDSHGTPHFVTEADSFASGAVSQDAGAGSPIRLASSPSSINAYDPDGTLTTEPTTINSLRRAFKLQEYLEKTARAGKRLKEWIKAHFDVNTSDARLQRPEYITGVKSPVVISEVLNTTGTAELPQGNMAGHAVGVTSGNTGSYYCEEHGFIIGIMSVMPKTAYMQGLPKWALKTDNPFQYYTPSFANIGEQEILRKEVFAFSDQDGEQGNSVFGYIPRYAEYKYENNRVAGDFATSLDFWHMARKFNSLPNLNNAFVSADPTDRIFAVTDSESDKLYCQVLNKVSVVRKMPKYGTPTF